MSSLEWKQQNNIGEFVLQLVCSSFRCKVYAKPRKIMAEISARKLVWLVVPGPRYRPKSVLRVKVIALSWRCSCSGLISLWCLPSFLYIFWVIWKTNPLILKILSAFFYEYVCLANYSHQKKKENHSNSDQAWSTNKFWWKEHGYSSSINWLSPRFFRSGVRVFLSPLVREATIVASQLKARGHDWASQLKAWGHNHGFCNGL